MLKYSNRLMSKQCLYSTVMMLLKNLNKYPQDRISIWKWVCDYVAVNKPLKICQTSKQIIPFFFVTFKPNRMNCDLAYRIN